VPAFDGDSDNDSDELRMTEISSPPRKKRRSSAFAIDFMNILSRPLRERPRYLRRVEARVAVVKLSSRNPNWREKVALQAFNGHEIVRFTDLPSNVGRRTMDRLVAKGLVEPVDSDIGRFSADYGWMRVRD
jgi:hypothetical protein